MLMPVPKNDEGIERPAKEGEHYSLLRKIGEGSFGIIYLGKSDLVTNDYVAVKFESRKSVAPQLRDEYRTYKNLHGRIGELRKERLAQDILGIPRVYYFGQETMFNYLILDYLGDSLEEKFDKCGRRFSIKTTAFLAIQMIARVQTIHLCSYIYRDIKPDNFLLGRREKGEGDLLFVVDFGMAKHYRNPATKEHIPYREKKSLSGTARYMSINTHLGREQSRRDDMEALGNVFLYFLRGSLPWQGLKARDNREKYEKIGQRKQTIRVEELCAGFPSEFASYVGYTRRLQFEEEPNYEQCKNWFKVVYDAQDPNEPLDWDKPEYRDVRRDAQSHYESPRFSPHHLNLQASSTQPHLPIAESNRNQIGVSAPPHINGLPSNKYNSPLHYHQRMMSPEEPKKSFWRRIFCLCKHSFIMTNQAHFRTLWREII